MKGLKKSATENCINYDKFTNKVIIGIKMGLRKVLDFNDSLLSKWV